MPLVGQIITFLPITYSLQAACVAVAALMQYFLMASFCWMLVEGIYIYLFVVKVYNITDKMHRYHGFCWGEEHRQEMGKMRQDLNKYLRKCLDSDLARIKPNKNIFKRTLFVNFLNEHALFSETVGSSSGVPELILKYF